MASAAVTENTHTPMASPNVRHTIGSSRNRFSRGDRLPNAHCTTRNSSEKMMLTSPRTPKPTATSVSVTRVLATLASVVIRGSSSPSPSPAAAQSSCTRPARIRRRGRASLPATMGDRMVLFYSGDFWFYSGDFWPRRSGGSRTGQIPAVAARVAQLTSSTSGASQVSSRMAWSGR